MLFNLIARQCQATLLKKVGTKGTIPLRPAAILLLCCRLPYLYWKLHNTISIPLFDPLQFANNLNKDEWKMIESSKLLLLRIRFPGFPWMSMRGGLLSSLFYPNWYELGKKPYRAELLRLGITFHYHSNLFIHLVGDWRWRLSRQKVGGTFGYVKTFAGFHCY